MSRFNDYKGLCAAIEDELARKDLKTPIKDKIYLIEMDIQTAVKLRMRDAIEPGTSVKGQEYIEVPEDFLEARFLQWTSDDTLPAIEVTSFHIVDRIQKDPVLAVDTVRLRVGAIHGNRLYIGPVPGTVTYNFYYKAGVEHLSEKVRTNDLLQKYPGALFYGALLLMAPYIGNDDRIQTWGPFYERALKLLEQSEWRSRTGHGGGLRMRPDVQVV